MNCSYLRRVTCLGVCVHLSSDYHDKVTCFSWSSQSFFPKPVVKRVPRKHQGVSPDGNHLSQEEDAQSVTHRSGRFRDLQLRPVTWIMRAPASWHCREDPVRGQEWARACGLLVFLLPCPTAHAACAAPACRFWFSAANLGACVRIKVVNPVSCWLCRCSVTVK